MVVSKIQREEGRDSEREREIDRLIGESDVLFF